MESVIEAAYLIAIRKRLQTERDAQTKRFEHVHCPLCGGEAVLGGRVGNSMNTCVQCHTCGNYQVCHQAEVNLIRNRRTAVKGHILSGISRANNDQYRTPQILLWVYDTSGNTEVDYYHFGGGQPIELTARQKLDQLLSSIQRRCDKQAGVPICVVLPDDRSLGFARSTEELLGLLSELENESYLAIRDQITKSEFTIVSVTLTAAGVDKPQPSIQIEKGISMPENIEIDGQRYEFFKWESLGTGGFSEVFKGHSEKHGPVAVKRIRYRKSTQASREVSVVNSLIGLELLNVLPVYAAGLDRDSSHLHVVMALGARSLKQAIEEDGSFDEPSALEIVKQIASGLIAIQNTNQSFHHRDLKPANVIELDSVWHIGDFGNCRFEDAETSVNTMADFKTPAYAAPEQWKRESTSIKTDVYALGCILFELLTKRPPFKGNNIRELHLNKQPPSCDGVTDQTKQALASMLMKSPDRRPAPVELFQSELRKDKPDAFAKLRASALKLHKEQEKSEISHQISIDTAAQTAAIVRDASTWLADNLVFPFLSQLEAALSGVGERSNLGIEVPKNARLTFNPSVAVASNYQNCRWDVIAESSVEVIRLDKNYTWGHSLIFGKLVGSLEPHTWHEIGFKQSALLHTAANQDMFHLYQNAGKASSALSKTMGRWGVGFGPLDIEEDLDQFFERWGYLFNLAIEGNLKTTRTFPPSGKWWQNS